MKADWDSLMAEYAKHEKVVIADVDCTAGGKDLCEQVGVRGYPTIKHGDPEDMQDYAGGRGLEDLRKFAQELKPGCGPGDSLENCTVEQKEKIEKYLGYEIDELKKIQLEIETTTKTANEEFEAGLDKIRETYKNELKEKEDVMAKAKNIGLLKSVLKHLENTKKTTDEL